MNLLRAQSTLAAFALAALVASCGGESSPTTPPGDDTTPEVFTLPTAFSPFSTTINVGGSVKFNITGIPHNVIFARTTAGAPADINVVSNTVVTRTFNSKGTFAFDCTVHPGMTGEIIVK
jgi:plastocyanin